MYTREKWVHLNWYMWKGSTSQTLDAKNEYSSMYVCENSAVQCIRYLDLEPIRQINIELYLLVNWITFYCDYIFNT
jgi:hypothetical protein